MQAVAPDTDCLSCAQNARADLPPRERHVHFHVMPRQPDLDPGLRGPRVFGLLGGDPASHVPAQVMDEVAISVGQALRLDS